MAAGVIRPDRITLHLFSPRRARSALGRGRNGRWRDPT